MKAVQGQEGEGGEKKYEKSFTGVQLRDRRLNLYPVTPKSQGNGSQWRKKRVATGKEFCQLWFNKSR
jgi:hypothetical protein